jgi:hypothetical protein
LKVHPSHGRIQTQQTLRASSMKISKKVSYANNYTLFFLLIGTTMTWQNGYLKNNSDILFNVWYHQFIFFIVVNNFGLFGGSYLISVA